METQHKDALGREIKAGDVIVHISRRSSTVYTHVGVVRLLMDDGSIRWTRIEVPWRDGEPAYFRPATTIYRTDLCCIVDLTEEQLRKNYGIPLPQCSECGWKSATNILPSGKCRSCEDGL